MDYLEKAQYLTWMSESFSYDVKEGQNSCERKIYSWSFGDDSPETNVAFSEHSYFEEGSYNLGVTISCEACDGVSSVDSVKVYVGEYDDIINDEIDVIADSLKDENYESYDAAAESLHESGLVRYFEELGVEGWAIIDKILLRLRTWVQGFTLLLL